MNRSTLSLALVVLLVPATVAASVVTYMDTPTLVRLSPVIVHGHVTAVTPVLQGSDAALLTRVEVTPAEVLRGPTGDGPVAFYVLGGRFGSREARVYGSPRFGIDEEVVVFLRPTKAGWLTVTGLFQGRVLVEGGEAIRTEAPDADRVRVLGQSRAEPARTPLFSWLDEVRRLAGAAPAAESWSEATTVDEDPITPSFTLLAIPFRRFEPDNGEPVAYRFNPSGAPAVVPGGARPAFVAALEGWNSTTGHALVLEDGGDTSAECFLTFDGISGISHNDPCGEVPAFDGGSCSGVLAIGGMSEINPFESKTVNGVSFARGLQGDVVLNDGADCHWSGPGNYEEVLTHELGHSFGLGHSCGDASSPSCAGNAELDEAQMRAFAHGDGRGADPRRDDVKGVRFIYPPEAFIDLLVTPGPFSTGDTFELTLDLNGTGVADLWFFASVPGSGVTGGLLQASLSLAYVVDLPLASYTFTGAEPPGNYVYLMRLIVPGGDPGNPGDILSQGVAVVSFSP